MVKVNREIPIGMEKLIEHTSLVTIRGLEAAELEPEHFSTVILGSYIRLLMAVCDLKEFTDASAYIDIQLDVLNSAKKYLRDYRKKLPKEDNKK